MLDLRAQLRRCFEGRVCLVGLGNVAAGDDGFGVRLVEALARKSTAWAPWDAAVAPTPGNAGSGGDRVYVAAGLTPERVIGSLAAGGFDHVIFVDAAACGRAPGSVVWLQAADLASRFPQVSTHRLSLGMLARLVEAGGAQAWLLGVQPVWARAPAGISKPVRRTLVLLRRMIHELLEEEMLTC